MNILITGITGNLGAELKNSFNKHKNIKLIPIVRLKNDRIISKYPHYILSDLSNSETILKGLHDIGVKIDCILHAAGYVNFRKAGVENQSMVKSIIDIAKSTSVPIYYVSTAYTFSNNSYEIDKLESEKLIIDSGLQNAIFKPSIITGNTKTGKINSFSGYYQVIWAFCEVLKRLKREGLDLNFPDIQCKVNIVPSDIVADFIVKAVINKSYGVYYLTNSYSVDFKSLLLSSLTYLDPNINPENHINFYSKSDEWGMINDNEFRQLILNFKPYISNNYEFPESELKYIISNSYIQKLMKYYKDAKSLL